MTRAHRAATHAVDVERAGIAEFETERARLRGLAYRMTGTPDDADDIVDRKSVV